MIYSKVPSREDLERKCFDEWRSMLIERLTTNGVGAIELPRSVIDMAAKLGVEFLAADLIVEVEQYEGHRQTGAYSFQRIPMCRLKISFPMQEESVIPEGAFADCSEAVQAETAAVDDPDDIGPALADMRALGIDTEALESWIPK